MDNNSQSYEQAFMQSIQQPSPPPSSIDPTKPNKSFLPIIISIILAFVVIIETIALVSISNKSANSSDDEEISRVSTANDSAEDISDARLTFDENYTIVALEFACIADDGAKYEFTKTKTYKHTDASSTVIDSGTYSIVNGGAVVLNETDPTKQRIIYYDGYYIMEGLDFYGCE